MLELQNISKAYGDRTVLSSCLSISSMAVDLSLYCTNAIAR